jgi:hypothetical protein
MKDHFSKILTERPRYGSRIWSYHDTRPRIKHLDVDDLDDLPKDEGYRYPHYYNKEFNDLIGPLERFLISRLGQKWDDVYSEIREKINANSTTQIHILGHLYWLVAVNVHIDENGIWEQPYKNWSHGAYRLSSGDIYVHPDTNILERIPLKKIKKLPPKISHHSFGHEKEVFKIGGIWYWGVYSDIPHNGSSFIHDRHGYLTVYRGGAVDIVGKPVSGVGRYLSDKRQVNSRDLKKYNLTNDVG